METKQTKRYLELQMEELKEEHAEEKEQRKPSTRNNRSENNAKIAALYEDTADYEKDLICFETELAIIEDNDFNNILSALIREMPDEERDYSQELKAVVEAGWAQLIETDPFHTQDQLTDIQKTSFSLIVDTLYAKYPNDQVDFEQTIKDVLVRRWKAIIDMKKEHIKEEKTALKNMGLKPDFAKRIYEEYHGLR